MDSSPEKYSQALACVFQATVNDMKSSITIWEDFAAKSSKLQSALKVSMAALGSFLDSFQKVVDLTTSSPGGTRELGASLTRWCVRHRSMEAKLKAISASLVEQLANPILDKIEEWKRNTMIIDKERTRDYKKARQEVKRASMDSLRMQKKARKANGNGHASVKLNGASGMGMGMGMGLGTGSIMSNGGNLTLPRDGGVAHVQLALAMEEVNARWSSLQEAEQSSLRKLLREQRSRLCFFVTCFRPIIEQEVSLLGEMACFQEIMEKLAQQAADANTLPNEFEQFLVDLRTSPDQQLKSFGGDPWNSSSPLLTSRTQSQSQSQLLSQVATVPTSDTLTFTSTSAAHSPVDKDTNAMHQLQHQSPATLVRHESFASVGSATLRRRSRNGTGIGASSGTNLQHVSAVSMSTASLVSNASRSSCSSVSVQKSANANVNAGSNANALAGLPASSAASALLCVAAATRSAAAKANSTSQDSGFISQDTLYASTTSTRVVRERDRDREREHNRDRPATAPVKNEDASGIWMHNAETAESAMEKFDSYIGQVGRQLGDTSDDLLSSRAESNSRGSSESPVSTWANWPEHPGYFDPKALSAQLQTRPHTVSVPNRRSTHSRPPISDCTFLPPANSKSNRSSTHIVEDSFERAMQTCLNADDRDPEYSPAQTPTQVARNDSYEFPAPPPAEVLDGLAADFVEVAESTQPQPPPPPPPSDYAEPITATVTRSLANESSPISKLIRQLSTRSSFSRPMDTGEYAQPTMRPLSRARPPPPQRRSSVHQSGAYAPTTTATAAVQAAGAYQSCGTARQVSGAGVTGTSSPSQRDRTSVMQVVSMAVNMQPNGGSGSLSSQAPLAVPIPAVRVSLGGIAACPPELSDRAGAILHQIKSGVNLRRCAASMIRDRSRPVLRF